MKMQLTQSHISNGKHGHGGFECPLALMLNDHTGEDWAVGEVHFWKDAGRTNNKRNFIRKLTSEMFVIRETFDKRSPLSPCELEVPIENCSPNAQLI
jgi:hypothetical protein